MQTAGSFQVSVHVYQVTQRHIPDVVRWQHVSQCRGPNSLKRYLGTIAWYSFWRGEWSVIVYWRICSMKWSTKLPICHSLHASVWFTPLINDVEGGVGPPERPVAEYLTVGHNSTLSRTNWNAHTHKKWAQYALPSKKALLICPVRSAYPPTAPSLLGSWIIHSVNVVKAPVTIFLLPGIDTDTDKFRQFHSYEIKKK
jgi:hypothetical protein